MNINNIHWICKECGSIVGFNNIEMPGLENCPYCEASNDFIIPYSKYTQTLKRPIIVNKMDTLDIILDRKSGV